MKIAIISGRYLFPLILAKEIKKKFNYFIVSICFRGETSKDIIKYSDKIYWLEVGDLDGLSNILLKEKPEQCIMAGQINPRYVFKISNEMRNFLNDTDFRPHGVFGRIVSYLENLGFNFIDSTHYLKEYLADYGVMNNLDISEEVKKDIEFGKRIISDFVKLDIGQTIVVKNRAVIALEAIEGTNNTIKRAYKIAKNNCCVLKFSRPNQDMRFDVPVVGMSTIKLLKKIKASALILEKNRVLILEKDKFLSLAKKYKIPVVGEDKLS